MKTNDHTEMNHYPALGLMAGLSFVSMYALMYSMVNVWGNVFNSLNQFYMAGLMTAPMVVIELLVMRMMYPDARRNALILSLSAAIAVGMFVGIRQQGAISDQQFLRSMIPHHAGAILMCQRANLRDSEIRELCNGIVSGQQMEIDQMRRMLNRLP